jgi:drug/metabolite transporter (DMT)-like permease
MGLSGDRRDKSGCLYLLTTIFFFSTYEVVGKSIAGRIDAFQVNFIRFLVGGLILLGVAAVKKELAVSRRDFALCVLAGVINVVISMSLINMSLALDGSSAAVSAVLFSCNPIFVSIFASAFDGERIGRKKIAALALGILGTILISFNKMDMNVRSLASPALAVLSAIFFGFYTVLGKKISVRTGSLRMNAWAFTTGSLILLVFLVLTKRPIVQFNPSITGRVVYLSIFVTGLAYLSYFKGLAIAGAGKGSLVFFLKPVLATALAFFFLGERINPLVCAGIALVLAGIWIVFGSPHEKARVQAPAKD